MTVWHLTSMTALTRCEWRSSIAREGVRHIAKQVEMKVAHKSTTPREAKDFERVFSEDCDRVHPPLFETAGTVDRFCFMTGRILTSVGCSMLSLETKPRWLFAACSKRWLSSQLVTRSAPQLLDESRGPRPTVNWKRPSGLREASWEARMGTATSITH